MTGCSPGEAREQPRAAHPPSDEPVVAEALVLLALTPQPALGPKNSSAAREFAHSLLVGLWLAASADNPRSPGSSARTVWAGGLGQQQLVFDIQPCSRSALVPPRVSIKRFLQSLPQAFKCLNVFNWHSSRTCPCFTGCTMCSEIKLFTGAACDCHGPWVFSLDHSC